MRLLTEGDGIVILSDLVSYQELVTLALEHESQDTPVDIVRHT